MFMLEKQFKDIINNIKKEINTTQIKTAVEINRNLVMMYYRLGKILNDNFIHGNKFIEDVSCELKLAFPQMSGFSIRNLKYMKKFYTEYKDDEDILQMVAQVPWGHNIVLMTKLQDINTRKIYAEATIENGWGRDMLVMQIESDYHLRIGNSVNNFKLSFITYDIATHNIQRG